MSQPSMSAQALADLAGISHGHLTRLARRGEVPGAYKKSGRWVYPGTPELRAWAADFKAKSGGNQIGSSNAPEDASDGLTEDHQDDQLVSPVQNEREIPRVAALAEALESRHAREETAFGPAAEVSSGDPGPRSEIKPQEVASAALTFHKPPASKPDSGSSPTLTANEWVDPIEHGRRLGRLGVILFTVPLLAVLIARLISFVFLRDEMDAATGGRDLVVLVATLFGVLPGLVGAVLMVIALHSYGVRNRWLFWGAVLPSLLWAVLFFPAGIFMTALMVSIFMWQVHIFFPPG